MHLFIKILYINSVEIKMGNCIHVFFKPKINKEKSNYSTKNNVKINNNKEDNIQENIVTIKNVKKIFKSFNVLDTNKNIIIGIWDNPNKSNKLGNQGIWIENHDIIYELVFGITCNGTVILYFKNNIVLKISKNNTSFLLELKNKNNIVEYSTDISQDIIKKLNKINNDSLDIDLIFNIIKK